MSGLSALTSVNSSSSSAASSLGRSADIASQVATMHSGETGSFPSALQNAVAGGGEANTPSAADQAGKDDPVRKAFQDFVAGTFYKQMFKALRSGQTKPAYMHGGSAEEMFQSQLDQQVAEDLARNHGSTLSDSLYESFRLQRGGSFAATA